MEQFSSEANSISANVPTFAPGLFDGDVGAALYPVDQRMHGLQNCL